MPLPSKVLGQGHHVVGRETFELRLVRLVRRGGRQPQDLANVSADVPRTVVEKDDANLPLHIGDDHGELSLLIPLIDAVHDHHPRFGNSPSNIRGDGV